MLFKRIKIDKSNLHAVPYKKCFAKTNGENGNPGITVRHHLLNVAEVCRALSKCLPISFEKLACFAISVAALHDIGKVSPGFQLKYFSKAVNKLIPELDSSRISRFCTDHCHTGASAIWQHNGDKFSDAPPSAIITASHHGSMRTYPLPRDVDKIFGGEAWSQERKNLIREMEKRYGKAHLEKISPALRDFAAGMVTISDWIGSDETFFSQDISEDRKTSSDIARQAVKACGLYPPEIVQGLSFKEIFGFSPFETQEKFCDMVKKPGIYVLEAPMGTGKTEAALYAAYRLLSKGDSHGIFFGLPTRLTSDRIYLRVNHFLDRICAGSMRPKLAHGKAWLSEYAFGGQELAAGRSWFSPRKRALLHPFVIGTIDQALLSVLNVKHHFVRTFALAGKVVILDEVHSYDGYTGTLLDEMAKNIAELGATVIILSATLTAERRAAFFNNRKKQNIPDYPLVTGERFHCACAATDKKAYTVSIQPLSDLDLAESAIRAVRRGNCVLCIANTVAKAQTWHDTILSQMTEGEFKTGLLHSKFPGFRRAQLEDEWMDILGKKGDRPLGCILVATQVVEQSVDIDADFLITELAPTDMLLQRMGRQWRHNRGKRPCPAPHVVIVAGDAAACENTEQLYTALGESSCKVYSPWVLRQTWSVWSKRQNIILPDDIRNLLEQTYALPEPGLSPMIQQLYDEFMLMREGLKARAKGSLSTVSSMPTATDSEKCATRYSDLPSMEVLLVKSVAEDTGRSARLTLASGDTVQVNAFKHDFAMARKLHQNLVSIALYLVARQGEIKTPPYLKKYFYDATPVFEWDDVSGEITRAGRKTDFRYSHQKGLFRAKAENVPSRSIPVYQSDWEGIDIFNKARFDW